MTSGNTFIPYNQSITTYSNTRIGTFSNVIDPDKISGNLTAKISDHLPQFAIIFICLEKSNVYEREW